jgi:hypothetical protein
MAPCHTNVVRSIHQGVLLSVYDCVVVVGLSSRGTMARDSERNRNQHWQKSIFGLTRCACLCARVSASFLGAFSRRDIHFLQRLSDAAISQPFIPSRRYTSAAWGKSKKLHPNLCASRELAIIIESRLHTPKLYTNTLSSKFAL